MTAIVTARTDTPRTGPLTGEAVWVSALSRTRLPDLTFSKGEDAISPVGDHRVMGGDEHKSPRRRSAFQRVAHCSP